VELFVVFFITLVFYLKVIMVFVYDFLKMLPL